MNHKSVGYAMAPSCFDSNVHLEGIDHDVPSSGASYASRAPVSILVERTILYIGAMKSVIGRKKKLQ